MRVISNRLYDLKGWYGRAGYIEHWFDNFLAGKTVPRPIFAWSNGDNLSAFDSTNVSGGDSVSVETTIGNLANSIKIVRAGSSTDTGVNRYMGKGCRYVKFDIYVDTASAGTNTMGHIWNATWGNLTTLRILSNGSAVGFGIIDGGNVAESANNAYALDTWHTVEIIMTDTDMALSVNGSSVGSYSGSFAGLSIGNILFGAWFTAFTGTFYLDNISTDVYSTGVPSITALTDSFNAGSLNTAKWIPFTGGGASLSYSGAGVQVTYPASSTSSTDGDLSSVLSYNLQGASAALKVTTMPSSSTAANAELRLHIDGSNYMRWVYEAGTLYAQYNINGTRTTAFSVTWSSVTHAYIRIRELDGVAFWETSTDGTTWTERFHIMCPINPTRLTVLIAGTCYQNETNPGSFVFQNFNTTGSVTTSSITKGLVYAIRKSASVTKTLTYDVKRTPSAITKSLAYYIRKSSSTTKGLTYDIKRSVSAITKSLKYTVIRPATAVTKTLTYDIRRPATAITKSLAYDVRKTASAITKSLQYATKRPVSVTKSLVYDIKRPATAITKSLKYTIKRPATAITKSLKYTIIRPASAVTKGLAYDIRRPASAITKSLKYTVKKPVTAITKSLAYDVRRTISAITKSLQYNVTATGTITITKGLQYAIKRTPAATTKSLQYAVRRSLSATKSLRYAIDKPLSITKSLKYTVKRSNSVAKTLVYDVKRGVAITKGLTYDVKKAAAITKSLTYRIKKSLSITKALQYDIKKPIAITKTLTYRVRKSQTAITKGLVYDVKRPTNITKSLRYAIVTTVVVTKTLRYATKRTPAITKQLQYVINVGTATRSDDPVVLYEMRTNAGLSSGDNGTGISGSSNSAALGDANTRVILS